MNSIFLDGFSEEDELRELKDENNRLLSLVAEKELEMKNMAKKRENDILLSSVKNLTNDAAAAKIVELSKKIREINSELQISQNNAKKFQAKCSDYETKLNVSPPKIVKKDSDIDSESQKDVMKVLQEKLKQNEFKLTETRTQISSLKTEIKVLNKVIAQEVGDGVPIQSLLSGERTNWKGRMQQVNTLQKKVNELKKLLEKCYNNKKIIDNEKGDNGGDEDDDDTLMYLKANVLKGKSSSSSSSLAARENIKNIEKSKMEQIQKLTDELASLEVSHSALKSKQEGLKARNQVLVNEVRCVKAQLKLVLEKAKHDEELVEALLKQQTQLRNALVESGKAHEKLSYLKNPNTSSPEQHNLQRLRNEVVMKDAKLEQLEAQLLSLLHCEEFDSSDSLEGHPKKHLNSNQNAYSGNELHCLRTLNLTLTFERDKLKAMLASVTGSNNELSKRVTEGGCELKACRKKCARLEGEVRRLYSGAEKEERTDASGKIGVEALHLKLETLEDEKRTLKVALEASFQAKNEQLGMCEEMLQQAREAYDASVKALGA